MKIGSPPCGDCVRCCISDAVRLLPHEDPRDYDVRLATHLDLGRVYVLNNQPNGWCVYLTEQGCSIYDRRPQMCRNMDCRMVAAALKYTEVRKVRVPIPVWRRGRELLKGEPPSLIAALRRMARGRLQREWGRPEPSTTP